METAPSSRPSAPAPAISVPRGIDGLELGMTPEQVGQLFTVKEDQDPVASVLAKYNRPEADKAVSQQTEALQRRFFRISPGVGKLPDGVTSADARTSHNVVYQIRLHYDEASVKKMGWEGVTYPYLAKYGNPLENTGTVYLWDDGRTRLNIEFSGAVISVFFTDKALEVAMKREEQTPR